MTTDIFAPLPEAPCQACIEDSQHQDESFCIVYCPHTRFGGLYIVEQGMWTLTGPHADDAEFRRVLFANTARQIAGKTH